MEKEDLGKNIQKHRVLNQLSQKELAGEMGIAVQSLSRIERGLSVPSFDNLVKIMDILKVTPNQLFIADSMSGALSEDIQSNLDNHKETMIAIENLNLEDDLKSKLYFADDLYDEMIKELNELRDSIAFQSENEGRYSKNPPYPEYFNFLQRFSVFLLGEVSHNNVVRLRNEQEKNMYSSRIRVSKNHDD
ncbi:helix-turn-helix transcriptional regulator [Listeria monocytogenes]|nr:helix-turn-helix transcriptional regulator [Listeria monocytogenes]